ncbi:MAG: DUF3987 domain-containing protein [Gammaproteobacteria bacterium]|nr:DUF3987 domain-containing protein [Gammaproteobacteria bacterium]
MVCATAAARRLQVLVRPGYQEPCNLWMVTALPPGNRKSSVQTHASDPLLAWEQEQALSQVDAIREAEATYEIMEAKIKALRKKAATEKDAVNAQGFAAEAAGIEKNLPNIPSLPRLWTSDVTPEKLGTLLAENEECMAWISSEGGLFDMLNGRYTKGIPNLDLFLKAHSGDAERVDRGSRESVFIKSARLSIGLSPQPDVLRGLAHNQGFRGRGLLGRFLYLSPHSPVGYRNLESCPIPSNVQQAYDRGMARMLNWKAPCHADDDGIVRHTLTLSGNAYDEWRSFAKAIEAEMRPGEALAQHTDWGAKAAGATARIAGVLHGIKYAEDEPWKYPIEEETLCAALKLITIIKHHSIYAMDVMGTDTSIADARYVWEWIDRNQMREFSIRDAHMALRSKFPRVKQLRQAIEILQERGYTEIQPPPAKTGAGRSASPNVIVRPE